MSIIDLPEGGFGLPPKEDTPSVATTIALEETGDVESENREFHPLVAYVKERYHRNKDKRYDDEMRWLKAYRNYRGLYGPDVKFTSTEKSKIFVKVTKTKVLAAKAQIEE